MTSRHSVPSVAFLLVVALCAVPVLYASAAAEQVAKSNQQQAAAGALRGELNHAASAASSGSSFRRMLKGVCDKCNIALKDGGCKCDNMCKCKPGQGGAVCDKCNFPVNQGGCKCDNMCRCISTTPPPGPSGSLLMSGRGYATYYYDQWDKCPSEPNGYPELQGYTTCESYAPPQYTLKQVGSNNVVAMDINLLHSNRARYCGKKVVIKVNGRQVTAPDGGDFYIWDGCAACAGNGIIDLSVSGIKRVDPNGCNIGKVPGVTWEVYDQQVKRFVA